MGAKTGRDFDRIARGIARLNPFQQFPPRGVADDVRALCY